MAVLGDVLRDGSLVLGVTANAPGTQGGVAFIRQSPPGSHPLQSTGVLDTGLWVTSSGSLSALYSGSGTPDFLWSSLAALGDVDASGNMHLMIGAPELSKIAFIFMGELRADFSTDPLVVREVRQHSAASLLAPGEDASSFGHALAVGGIAPAVISSTVSHTHPAHMTLVVGAPNALAPSNHSTGLLHLVAYRLATPGTRLASISCAAPGSQPGDQFGYSVAALPDMDFDGHSDLAIGAPGANGGGGGCTSHGPQAPPAQPQTSHLF